MMAIRYSAPSGQPFAQNQKNKLKILLYCYRRITPERKYQHRIHLYHQMATEYRK
jgi:hypothetical protein